MWITKNYHGVHWVELDVQDLHKRDAVVSVCGVPFKAWECVYALADPRPERCCKICLQKRAK